MQNIKGPDYMLGPPMSKTLIYNWVFQRLCIELFRPYQRRAPETLLHGFLSTLSLEISIGGADEMVYGKRADEILTAEIFRNW